MTVGSRSVVNRFSRSGVHVSSVVTDVIATFLVNSLFYSERLVICVANENGTPSPLSADRRGGLIVTRLDKSRRLTATFTFGRNFMSR